MLIYLYQKERDKYCFLRKFILRGDDMYKIKEFSMLSNTAQATLRYYDEIGLFKPSYVDFYSGYRYYEEEQINIIKKINKLKAIGLSLEKIKEYMETKNAKILTDKMNGYEQKIEELKKVIDEQEKINYEVIKGDYAQYLLLNGLLKERCAMALEIKDGKADYYYIEKNNIIISDFVIYKENNWLTLKEELDNVDLMTNVFKTIQKDYHEVVIIIPENAKVNFDYLFKHYKCQKEMFLESGFKYQKITIRLENDN